MVDSDCPYNESVSYDLPDSVESVVHFSLAEKEKADQESTPWHAPPPWHARIVEGQLDELRKFRRPIKVNLLMLGASQQDAEQLQGSLAERYPEIQTTCVCADVQDLRDYCQVYRAIYIWLNEYDWAPGKEKYFGNTTNGAATANACMMQAISSGLLTGDAVSTGRGGIRIFDLPATQRAIAQSVATPPDQSWLLGRVLPWSVSAQSDREIIGILREAIKTDYNQILILGDTGVGKTRLARMIHKLHGGPFQEANCATIRGDTARSELFGHKKGAFTGAQSDRRGLLLEADGGVLFLDEIGELGLEEQGMLLKAIEEGKFFPVGSDKLVESKFTLISGTNRDLDLEVLHGRFREDLYWRISGLKYRLPSLSESKEGIPSAINDALKDFCEKNKAGKIARFEVNAEKSYVDFASSDSAIWPGNFRELRASVRRMALFSTGGIITEDLVLQEIGRLQSDWSLHQQNQKDIEPESSSLTRSGDTDEPHQLVNAIKLIKDARGNYDEAELQYAEQLINACRQAKSKAQAAQLFIPVKMKKLVDNKKVPNPTQLVNRLLEKYGISWEDVKAL